MQRVLLAVAQLYPLCDPAEVLATNLSHGPRRLATVLTSALGINRLDDEGGRSVERFLCIFANEVVGKTICPPPRPSRRRHLSSAPPVVEREGIRCIRPPPLTPSRPPT